MDSFELKVVIGGKPFVMKGTAQVSSLDIHNSIIELPAKDGFRVLTTEGGAQTVTLVLNNVIAEKE